MLRPVTLPSWAFNTREIDSRSKERSPFKKTCGSAGKGTWKVARGRRGLGKRIQRAMPETLWGLGGTCMRARCIGLMADGCTDKACGGLMRRFEAQEAGRAGVGRARH